MTELYTVRVTKDYLVFSAGHFITFNNGHCERLHGHNYRVAVEIDGPLDGNYYVFDFIALKDAALAVVMELDHRMLVATKNPLLPVTVEEREVTVRFEGKRWVFPKEDCAVLEMENTTAELLAKHIGGRILHKLGGYRPQTMRVEVEESFGQLATWHSSFQPECATPS